MAPTETCGLVAHLHDRALAELPLDLAECRVESLLAIHLHPPPRRTAISRDLVLRPVRAQQGMVDSGLGRTDLARGRAAADAAAAAAEADDGDVRKPGALLALVDAEPLEPLMEVAGERGRMPLPSSKTSIPTLRVSR